MLGLEFDFPVTELRKKLLFQHKIFTGSSKNPKVLRILPPLTVKKQHINQFVEALKQELKIYVKENSGAWYFWDLIIPKHCKQSNMKQFIDLQDLQDIPQTIQEAINLKKNPYQFKDLGQHKTLVMLFFNSRKQKVYLQISVKGVYIDKVPTKRWNALFWERF